MNIKGLAGQNQIVSGVSSKNSATPVDRAIKSDESHDRDANGQSLYQKQQKKKEKMNREQAEKALAILNKKQFMKDMNWVASLVEENGFFSAEVKNQDNEIIRRLHESDMWELFENQNDTNNSTKGQLLKKTA